MAQVKMKYGIDLGTTNSAICKMENGDPCIRKTDVLKDTLPSCVSFTLNPQLHSRSATYIKRNGLLIRKITIKSSRPFQCAYHPLTP